MIDSKTGNRTNAWLAPSTTSPKYILKKYTSKICVLAKARTNTPAATH